MAISNTSTNSTGTPPRTRLGVGGTICYVLGVLLFGAITAFLAHEIFGNLAGSHSGATVFSEQVGHVNYAGRYASSPNENTYIVLQDGTGKKYTVSSYKPLTPGKHTTITTEGNGSATLANDPITTLTHAAYLLVAGSILSYLLIVLVRGRRIYRD